MTLPDPNLDRLAREPDNIQDRVPPTERGEDPAREAIGHSLVTDGSRALTADEQKAAEHDTPLAERVYAPASERVPREPMPGHRDMVEHADPNTPERHAASTEPTFTRVARPGGSVETPTSSPYAAPTTSPGYTMPESWDVPSSSRWTMGAWLILPISAGIAVWLYLRWRRERNKPINRIRRQAARARKAADDLRGRVPDTSDVAQPALGLFAALASTAVVLLRQMRSQKVTRHAAHTISDADWQKRLLHLKERWTPHRVELEKVQISRH